MQERGIVMIDIDRTAYKDYLLFPIFNQQISDGLISGVFGTQMESLLAQYQHGDFGYESMVDIVVKKWAEALKGKSTSEIETHTQDYLRQNKDNFRSFVPDVINLTKATHDSFFVTGEPQFVSEAAVELFNADGHVSSDFGVAHGKFTGDARVLAWSHQKLEAIGDLMKLYEKKGSFAFGDSDGDVEMLASVEYPICINPNKGLKENALANNWPMFDSSSEVMGYVRSKLMPQI